MRRNDIQDLGRGIAAGKRLRVSREPRQFSIPAIGKRLRLHPLESAGKIGVPAAVGFGQPDPGLMEVAAAPANAIPEMLAHAIRHQKSGVFGPVVAALGEADLLLAERVAMGRAGVLLVGCPITDMAFDDRGRIRSAIRNRRCRRRLTGRRRGFFGLQLLVRRQLHFAGPLRGSPRAVRPFALALQ